MRGLAGLLLGLLLAGCRAPSPSPEPRILTLATTTSVGHAGLLDRLLPLFEEAQRIRVRTHLVGSGRALAMLEAGEADAVISHAPAAEAEALGRRHRWHYRKIMFNDFVIAGPVADPADVRGAAGAADAMRRIARSRARFISRGDSSGTHEREEALWRQAGERPPAERLVAAGAGMGSTLRVAGEAGAYTLTDRATFVSHEGRVPLAILYEGDPAGMLLNTYAVIVDPAGTRAADAAAFAEWLAGGVALSPFERWPAGRPSGRPSDLPR